MSDVSAIRVGGQPAGLLVRGPHGVRFFASAEPFFELDGRLYRGRAQVERVLSRIARASGEHAEPAVTPPL